MYKKVYEKIFRISENNLKEITAKSLDGNLKTKKKMIEIHNPYHHNFELDYNFERSSKKIFFDVFDILRIFLAGFIVIKIGMKLPSYILFRRNKFENNPDFMICDQAEFERLNI
jgi:hypothetical protein